LSRQREIAKSDFLNLICGSIGGKPKVNLKSYIRAILEKHLRANQIETKLLVDMYKVLFSIPDKIGITQQVLPWIIF